MKGIKHPKNDLTINPSGNDSIFDVIGRVEVSRRRFIQGSASASMLAAAGGLTLSGIVGTVEAAVAAPVVGIGFTGVPASLAPVADVVTVPAGYTAKALVAWGDPIMAGGVAYKADATNTAAEQAKQYGMHTDGMHFFPFPSRGQVLNDRGILCANNEYTHEEILFPDGQVGTGYTIEKCRKSQAAHGVSILEVRRINGKWNVVPSSIYGRRLTANTPMRVSGPAAGHALMKANEYTISPSGSVATGNTTDGYTANGTINNCANGITPWGTYLTCEENWNGNFGANAALPAVTTEAGKLYNRYGVVAAGFGYRWHTVDPRFDLAVNPNESNLFGWVVEVDPMDPTSKPVKRTALGRFKHESAQYVVDSANNIAFYLGDDERNEYIYKFVCAGKYNPTNRAANRDLLDSGTLYVARFDADLTGTWLPLTPDSMGLNGVALRDNPNFVGANDDEVMAKILIKTRMAADAVGATMMDRPEWTGARPRINGYDEIEVYCTLTNNNRRGSAATPSSNNANGSTTAASARPAVDAANPYADNIYGHIIRWREDGKTVLATEFGWDIFAQCGDTATTKAAKSTNDYKGNIEDTPDGSADIGAPDGLWFDWFGRLWVQTDQVGDASGDWLHIGANSLSCVDPVTKEFRRFLTGPNKCEVTGITMSPDGKTLFVGVQHPGEDATAANPTQYSNWPASQWATRADGVTALPGGRPRSSVVVITKDDGGIIGA
ncbi:PhoX family protein [Ferribacterium limneticum]|uniref:PhoX family protein n=1 Tax=Ferribacterium limneticum TaxID=76259 RepID=UPI001CFA1C76|nr:PhoX family phosphatase [Ferribacterium limneticum]UCV28981.1 PhoX family phosphatase [Ferribacterium limneticum]UCV32899.1 PhoX family phosphatase [Ferribacterium limneticum]